MSGVPGLRVFVACQTTSVPCTKGLCFFLASKPTLDARAAHTHAYEHEADSIAQLIVAHEAVSRVRGARGNSIQRVVRSPVTRSAGARYRLGWPRKPPWVGQSFLAERLGMTLTSRLRTPPDRPSHHTRPGALSFFFLPGSPGASLGSRFPDTAPQREKQDRALRYS